ncbi:SMI1/KNR4 family protein [Chitinophaga tropicalis]|uniref:Knr4/Smi1-like domain-containing protein n=1 Tax=Chitinophaga tropicalis TaxID=2683588 RepID=A0A7K1U6G9_9BACT|nr:SMI1/KNR4 family protein [Chitinophaga tropicalis]MVT09939.1 hypothetical protein [Chitinophaga tropicalis]
MKYLSFLKANKKHLGDPQGLNEDEITAVEQAFNVKLPLAYKEFLSVFGKKRGRILRNYGSEASYLARNKADALKAFNNAKEKGFAITDSQLFFGVWQELAFYFFDCAEGNDDPPVYVFNDSGKMEHYKDSFSLLIKDELDAVLKFDKKR